MNTKVFFIFCVVVLFISSFLPLAAPIEEYKTEADEAAAYNVTRVVKTVEGLHFSVQEDMPIEKIAGVYRPVDMDSYIAIKFRGLEEKIDEAVVVLNKRIDALEKKVDGLQAKGSVLTSSGPAEKTSPAVNNP